MFTATDVPYGLDDKMNIYLRTKNKNYEEVWNCVKPDEKCPYECWYEDWNSHQKKLKDPEEVSWESISINLEDFINLGQSQDVMSKIEEVRFGSAEDNSDECNRTLAMFYKFFDAIDCNPDASESERCFLDCIDEPMYNKMRQIIKAKGKYENE